MEKITQAKISYYDGDLCLRTNGNPILVDISYKGKIVAESNMPDGFIVLEKSNRIIIMRFNNNQMPEHIFSYIGDFKIKIAKVYGKSGAGVVSEIDTLSHKWANMAGANDSWGSLTSTWESYSENGKFSMKPIGSRRKLGRKRINSKKSVIINNNLSSSMGKFYLPDGSIYNGNINYDSRGIFSTGSSKTKDSITLAPEDKKIKLRKR